MIDVRRFVDINIVRKDLTMPSGTNDTAVFISNAGEQYDAIYSSIDEVPDDIGSGNMSYAKMFFDNGGIKLHMITKFSYNNSAFVNLIRSLPDSEIAIAIYTTSANITQVQEYVSQIISTMSDEMYGIRNKIFSLAVTAANVSTLLVSQHVCYKYISPVSALELAEVMLPLAYLTKIDISEVDSLRDYCYTSEITTAVDITDSLFGELQQKNVNVDIYLANAVRNVGGNCSDGSSLVNNYLRTVLQQTITDRLIALLATKLKNSSGVTKIYSEIISELQRYVNFGYLTTDKIWTKDDVMVNYSGKAYTVIKQGTPLINGYHLTVLPIQSLSDKDRAARKAPPIYLILAEQYSIRVITINGEVI